MFSRRLLIVAVIAVSQAPADWTATESLPDTYTAHTMVHSQGYLYHVGGLSGHNGISDADKVFYAQVTGPGTIDPWVAGLALPALSFSHAAAAWGDKIYVLGGQHWDGAGGVLSSNVYFSQIGNNGVPGAWQTSTPMPESVFLHSVVVSNGRIYVMGGQTPAGFSDRVYFAEINPDGTLGSWASLVNLPQAVFAHTVVADDAIYVLGGVITGNLTNVVYMAPIMPDGTVGPWVTTTPLPAPVSDHEAAVIGGRVYVLGGWTGAPTAAVHSAQILPDKTLGAWQSEASLPVALYLHASATDGQAIFASGGSDGVAAHNAVYGLPVTRCPADLDCTIGPSDFSAFRGFYVSGDLDSLLASDDSDLCYEPGIVLNPTEAPITLDFVGTLPNDSPASLDVTIESSANTVGLELTFSFWNFNTNSWDVVGTDAQSLNEDTVRTFAGEPTDHVEPGTGEVRTRYEVRVVSFIFLFPWLDCVDQVFWTVS